jgi:hypothetical protein
VSGSPSAWPPASTGWRWDATIEISIEMITSYDRKPSKYHSEKSHPQITLVCWTILKATISSNFNNDVNVVFVWGSLISMLSFFSTFSTY